LGEQLFYKQKTIGCMKHIKYLLFLSLVLSCSTVRNSSSGSSPADDLHRPLVHFTPREKWMNDPNGMVYHNGTYHLFYQYYPDSTVWGPMHWGHATSRDLVHWEHQPIALYPDSLGYIFSGSAVIDEKNTTGFGKNGQPAMVAIFTHHDPKWESAGRNDYQNQSLAYSLDEGKTWTKYAGNPVLKNPGIKDFRDPKVMWYEPGNEWIMTLATLDRITFYSSPDLKQWKKESEFGKEVGAHGGVWECPDLFQLNYNGQNIWVLIVNLNPGGPNGGSATQYFLGDFDGKAFKPFSTETKWLDYGPDEYAGVTWSNTGKRKIFLGWMSNWQYATVVPTLKWRSAMTVPRDLGIQKIGESYYITSKPVPELNVLDEKPIILNNIEAGNFDLTAKTGLVTGPTTIQLKASQIADLSIELSNEIGQKVIVGFDHKSNTYFTDRTASGKVEFEKGFAARHTAPRLSRKQDMDMTLVIDNASIELFADGGTSVMTAIYFPGNIYSRINIQSPGNLQSLEFKRLKSIY
jgi:fructan beta-fructosidase